MESTCPIRALARGLDALTVLNLRDGATVSEVAQKVRLPRTTVYPLNNALGLFLPKLLHCVGRIGVPFTDQHAAASASAKPDTAA